MAEAIRDEIFERLWQRAHEEWADGKRHTALLEHAIRTEALPELAGRYRSLVDDPERAAVARERLDAIVVAATSLLLSTKTPAPGRVPLSITLSAFGVCALLLAWLSWALWGSH